MSLFFVILCLIFIVAFAYYKLRYPFVKQMNKIPGPNGLPLIGIVDIFFSIPRNKQQETVMLFFKQYGPIFRTWIGTKCIVHVGNAEYAQKILSSTVNIEKSFLYNFFIPYIGNSLPIMKSAEWHERRKLLNPAFHFTILNDYVSTMVKNCQIFTERLEQEINSDKFDIYPYILDCTVDIIGETAMSVKLDTQKGSSEMYVKNIHRFKTFCLKRVYNPLVHFDFIYALTSNFSKMMKVAADLHKVSSGIIEQRIAERPKKNLLESPKEIEKEDYLVKKKHKTFLEILLDQFYEEGHHKKMTLENIREEVDTFMFAGHDTVSVAVAIAIFLVGHHPEVQDKIHAELDAVLPTEDCEIDNKTITQLKYLECVFLESMRLYPPAATVARCLTEPVSLGDYTIPAGTDVAVHFHQIQKSSEYFPNPNKFDPSNFSSDKVKNIHPYAYLPFSAGPRNCIGQKFGKLESKIALALFFKKYEVTSTTKIEDLTMFCEVVIRPEHGIPVRIKKRS